VFQTLYMNSVDINLSIETPQYGTPLEASLTKSNDPPYTSNGPLYIPQPLVNIPP
jgi:hypothetical protein